MIGRRIWLSVCLLFVVSTVTPLALAERNFPAIYIFGDSLSDTGNLGWLAGGGPPPLPPPPPRLVPTPLEIQGVELYRFSNGKLYTEYLAEQLGQPCNRADAASRCDAWPAYAALGNNWAVAGSETGPNPNFPFPFPNLQDQVDHYLAAAGTADPEALYIVYSGSNDLLNALPFVPPAQLSQIASASARRVIDALKRLNDAGVRNFLLIGVPNVGLVPFFDTADKVAGTKSALVFNTVLLTRLFTGGIAGRAWYLDSFAVLQYIGTDARFLRGKLTGIKNIDTPCAPSLNRGVNCKKSLFFDDIHPTTRFHQILANFARQVLNLPPLISNGN